MQLTFYGRELEVKLQSTIPNSIQVYIRFRTVFVCVCVCVCVCCKSDALAQENYVRGAHLSAVR
jgi:hypothetical protein